MIIDNNTNDNTKEEVAFYLQSLQNKVLEDNKKIKSRTNTQENEEAQVNQYLLSLQEQILKATVPQKADDESSEDIKKLPPLTSPCAVPLLGKKDKLSARATQILQKIHTPLCFIGMTNTENDSQNYFAGKLVGLEKPEDVIDIFLKKTSLMPKAKGYAYGVSRFI